MTHHHLKHDDHWVWSVDDQDGDDTVPAVQPFFAPHAYKRRKVFCNKVMYLSEVLRKDPQTGAITVQSSSQSGPWSLNDYANYRGLWEGLLPVDMMFSRLNMKLIQKVKGDSFDPTMFIKDLDDNLHLVVKRSLQAVEFLNNLRNPGKLARLTLRYFRGDRPMTRRKLTRRYRSAKQEYIKRANRNWQSTNVSSAYLEYSFGWRPLCEDINNLVNLSRSVAKNLRVHGARATLGPLVEEQKMNGVGGYGEPGTAHVEVAGHARMLWMITHPWLRATDSLDRPEYALWDTLPFSWLVDCLTNVGDHLKYSNYHVGLSLIGGHVSVLRKVRASTYFPTSQSDWQRGSWYSYSYIKGTVDDETAYRTEVFCERRVIKTWPDIPWIDRRPSTMKNLGILMSISAFVHQTISRMVTTRFWDYVRPFSRP